MEAIKSATLEDKQNYIRDYSLVFDGFEKMFDVEIGELGESIIKVNIFTDIIIHGDIILDNITLDKIVYNKELYTFTLYYSHQGKQSTICIIREKDHRTVFLKEVDCIKIYKEKFSSDILGEKSTIYPVIEYTMKKDYNGKHYLEISGVFELGGDEYILVKAEGGEEVICRLKTKYMDLINGNLKALEYILENKCMILHEFNMYTNSKFNKESGTMELINIDLDKIEIVHISELLKDSIIIPIDSYFIFNSKCYYDAKIVDNMQFDDIIAPTYNQSLIYNLFELKKTLNYHESINDDVEIIRELEILVSKSTNILMSKIEDNFTVSNILTNGLIYPGKTPITIDSIIN